MKNPNIHIVLTLALALFAVQGMTAFTAIPEKVEFEKFDLKYVETTNHGLEYVSNANTLKIESARHTKIPVVFYNIPHKFSIAVILTESTSSSSEFFVRDQKHSLKILIFPFHTFW